MTNTHRKPVIDIFNYYIENGFAAYPEATLGYEFFDRFLEMSKGYPAVVAKAETGEVIGFGFLHAHHPASTFKRTAEITYFVLPGHTRRGVGGAMLQHLVEKARKLGVDCLLASISSRNLESLEFHRKHGFKQRGRFKEIGRKFGEDFDVVWMQKRI